MDNLLDLIRRNNIFGGDNETFNKPRITPFNPQSPDIVIGGDNSRLFGGDREPFRPDTSSMFRGRPDWENIISGRGNRNTALDDDSNDLESIISSLYHPDTTYNDMYQKAIGEMPQRNKPGFGRKLAASLVGFFGGPQGANMTMYGGYNNKMADWKTKLDALQPGLQAEKASNANLRQIATAAASDKLRERDITRKEKADQARLDREQNDSNTRRMRAEAYVKNLEFKQQNPKHELVGVKGGNYYWFDPQNPGSEPIDTGIATGTLDRVDELNLQQRNRLEGIAATGAEARKTEGVRHVNDLSEIGARTAGQVTVKQAPTTPEGTVEETKTTTTVTDNEGKPIGTRTTSSEKARRPGNVRPGFTRMVSPDGKSERDIPNDQVEAYKKKGAKVKGK